MKKAHAPEKLHLQFQGKMNATMIEMTEDFKDKITSLDIRVEDNEDLLLQPSFIFKSLESLTLTGGCCTDDTMVRVYETMLAKHANNLKKLRIDNLEKNLRDPNLRVPNLPVLESLELRNIDYIPDNVVWPQFPKLRELKINYSECLPILMNTRETLEHLYLEDIVSPDIAYASVVMPRLTDMHLFNVNSEFTSKICSLNHRSLEFLYLERTDLPNLDDGIKMERMRNVVLRYKYPSYTAQDMERITEMCPNAEVVIMRRRENRKEIRDQMRSRCKSKKFSLDFIRF